MSARKVRNARDAQACLEAAAASGQDRRAWAAANGVNPRSLNAWRINLARGEARRPTLVELVPAAAGVALAQYRVVCGGFAVEFDAGFDDASRRRLLAVVASC